MGFLLSKLIPHLAIESTVRKRRVGPSEDGGYVVADELSGHTDVLVSAGVGEDVRFETDFYSRYASKGILIDPYVSTAVADESCAELVLRAKVGEHSGISSSGSFSLDELLEKAKLVSGLSDPRVTLKMDIEWDEWDVLEQASSDTLRRFDQILIEFHLVPVVPNLPHPLSGYFQTFQFLTANKINAEMAERYSQVMAKLQRDFSCIHLHANNSLGVHSYFGEAVPYLLEATFIRNDFARIQKPELEVQSEIELLDAPNKLNRPDISGLQFQRRHG